MWNFDILVEGGRYLIESKLLDYPRTLSTLSFLLVDDLTP